MSDHRISRQVMFMQIAEVISRRSTCFRRNVGAIIVRDNNIVSMGYNGPDHGEPHCTGNGCADPVNGCTRSIHAEKNAVDRVPEGLFGPFTMYVTESPCPDCAQYILNQLDIREVYFMHQYRVAKGCDMIVSAGVKLFRVTPAGHIIDWETGHFIEERS